MTANSDEDVNPPIRDERGRFLRGNPGRPPGTRVKLSKRALRQVHDNFDLLIGVLIYKALEGDTDAAKFLLSLGLPKDQPVDLPELSAQSVADAVMSGEVTPTEGRTLATTLAKLREVQDVDELRARLEELERSLAGRAVR